MKIALLGYGLEGQATKKYFETKDQDISFDIFDHETPEEFRKRDYSAYDFVFRSPSIPPLHLPNESTITRYFFDHCPCPIIGVTATKGKGTTCSFIKALLDSAGTDAYLVGNIGTPAITVLDQLRPTSVVVYELSSFQLWDLEKSPHIAIVGHLEPDHLNVHRDYADYLDAKSHICRYQTTDDYCIYYQENPESTKLAELSSAHKLPYPFEIPALIRDAITLPGRHNQENCIAALAAVACYKNISPDEYFRDNSEQILAGLAAFRGLPHRLEFLRELNGVRYYDDNFSTNPSSTRVAIAAFPNSDISIIIGGRDKTDYTDLDEIHEILSAPQIKQIILIGESGHELAKRFTDPRFVLSESLEDAINSARTFAEAGALNSSENTPIVLMSPAAASFDMFENVYDRGAQYQRLIANLN